MTIALQALTLVEKAEPIQVHFALRLKDHRSMWMQGGCKLVKSTWIPTWHQLNCVSWSLGLFSLGPVAGRPHTKPGDHGTPNAHNRWFILSYHVWGPAWIEVHWISICLRFRSNMTSHYTWGSVTTLHDFWRCGGTTFGHFLSSSHNFMVTALGLCMKWPLV